MPPSLRRTAPQQHLSPQQADFSDSDDVDESRVESAGAVSHTMADALDGIEGEDDLEDEDALGEYSCCIHDRSSARCHVKCLLPSMELVTARSAFRDLVVASSL
jgi:hypothetical protein